MLDTTRIYDEVNRIVVEGQGKTFDRDFHRKLKARDVLRFTVGLGFVSLYAQIDMKQTK